MFQITPGFQIAADAYEEWAPFQPDRPARCLEQRYTNEASEFIQVDDARIHYRDEGPESGPTLLALHGTYSSLHTWDGWVEQLSDDVRVVRLDMPGFGLTGPREDGSHSLPALIEAVAQFCDELGLSDVAVAGNSLGGAVAWRLALDRPDLVSRLLLLDTGGNEILSDEAEFFTENGMSFFTRYVTPRSLTRLILKDAYGDESLVTNELVRRYHDLLVRVGNRRVALEIAQSFDGDEYDASNITCPTLFQWGSEDSWLPVAYGREFASAIPENQFEIYDGAGHVVMEEQPEPTAADATAFLSQ